MVENWVDVAAREAVPDMTAVSMVVQGREIAFFNVDGDIYATDNLCTHGAARLTDGFLEGNEIECPLHQGRFDVCSGKALCDPLTEDVKTYRVKVQGDRIFVQLG
jgi:naphthalene 1,2-dioxygenase system ferredoxin subunit